VIAAIDSDRSDAFESLREAMRTARWRSMLEALEAATVLPPLGISVAPTGDARRAVRRLVRTTWHRLEHRVAAAERGTAHWHDVRKAAKSMRYAGELLEPLLGPGARTLARECARIQTELGQQQDQVVARAWLLRHAGEGPLGRASAKLLAYYPEQSASTPPHWRRMWKQTRKSGAEITGATR
jgi:CHAD domain-containing protein